ncbi:MAG: hypothetical protein HXY20_00060 [Acidobacteria bacterium]|nr:hypothetical protein [Acidobacteriota bacterium]
MKHKWCAMAGALVLVFAAAAAAQSLAELARKEKERREQVKSSAPVITNSDTAKYAGGAVTTQSLPSDSGKPAPGKETGAETPEAGVKPKADKPADDEPTDLFGRPESFWRQTLGDARKKVKDLEDESRILQLRIADLQNRFYREDNGFAQQELQREINKTFYEQDLNKQNLAKAKAELQQLEVEARKSGALPGWIEGRP